MRAQPRMLASRTIAHMRNIGMAAGPRCGLERNQRFGKRRGRLSPAPRLAQGLAQAPARKRGRLCIPCRFCHIHDCLHSRAGAPQSLHMAARGQTPSQSSV